MKRFLFVLALLFPLVAFGQGAIQQSGVVVPQDFACWLKNGIQVDCGISSLSPTPLPVLTTGQLLGNEMLSPIAAHPVALSSLIDSVCGTPVQGQILFRSSSAWVCLQPGTSGNFLQTLGAGLNPLWGIPPQTVYVGGTGINVSGPTISLVVPVAVANGGFGNTGGTSGGLPCYTGDQVLSSTSVLPVGSIPIGSGTGACPTPLSPGSNGQVLVSTGPSSPPGWQSAPTGTVTEIDTDSSGLSGGPITGTGTLSCNVAGSGAPGCVTPDTNATHYLDGGGNWSTPAGLAPVPLRATTTAIGGGSLSAGVCASATVTVTGALTSMVATASPAANPLQDSSHGLSIFAFVSGANTVTVNVCAIVSSTTPVSTNYNVIVNQ